jgi:uroporphyrinogen III methyltransferase/synthase
MNSVGCVYLVGAGCGEADLITLRGLERLKNCDVLIYDDLIDNALLSQVPETAETLYVGKRSGKHSMAQADINELLVARALQGKRVVRLKGGDPFVFGRGGEEIQALQAHGIPYEEVPGISSSIAIPAAAGIPVTHRGLSRSLHIITGHTADTPDGLPVDMDTLAQLSGTLVFLMGLGKLEAISKRLIAAGKSPETSAAVISGGNAPHPMTLRGTLETLPGLASEAKMQSPAVIVVGQVAGLDLSATLPLSGARIAVTGTKAIQEKLRGQLSPLGAQVSALEQTQVVPLPCSFDFSRILDGKAHWVVLTSVTGTEEFFRVLKQQSIDLRRLYACRFAVIGPGTGSALSQHGIIPDLCPETYTSEALAQALCQATEEIPDVFLFRSSQGSPMLPKILSERYQVEDVALYDITARPLSLSHCPHYLTFASASGVSRYFSQHSEIPENTRCVCIGAPTASALSQRYTGEILVAQEATAEGMVQAILENWNGLRCDR